MSAGAHADLPAADVTGFGWWALFGGSAALASFAGAAGEAEGEAEREAAGLLGSGHARP
jgi:hypothetical protein